MAYIVVDYIDYVGKVFLFVCLVFVLVKVCVRLGGGDFVMWQIVGQVEEKCCVVMLVDKVQCIVCE